MPGKNWLNKVYEESFSCMIVIFTVFGNISNIKILNPCISHPGMCNPYRFECSFLYSSIYIASFLDVEKHIKTQSTQ